MHSRCDDLLANTVGQQLRECGVKEHGEQPLVILRLEGTVHKGETEGALVYTCGGDTQYSAAMPTPNQGGVDRVTAIL